METKTPNALGYRMPAEWELHEGTFLATRSSIIDSYSG